MGQTLSEPSVEKTSERNANKHLIYGVSAMQGWRISMEDAHVAVLDLLAKSKLPNSEKAEFPTPLSLFGVFDGHGGDRVALYAGGHIDSIISSQEAFKQRNYEQALRDGFLATDRAILADEQFCDDVSGCTACVGLVAGDKLYLANAGDSRSVLGIKGRAKPLSQDHKPQLSTELARITTAGGFVEYGRVNGNLALSRALGDFMFKSSPNLSPEAQMVTAYPDVEVHTLSDNDEFMVIACDGIWDCQSSQSVVEFVRRGIAAHQDLDRICENLMDNCLASNSDTGGVGCDNMTMIIVGFLNGRTEKEWYDEIAKRVAAGDGPCAPPEYALFRGPGVHSKSRDNSIEFEDDDRPFGIVGHNRVIHLGDGSEVATDLDLEMLDEESDLQSQVPKSSPPSEPASDTEAELESDKSKTDTEKPKMKSSSDVEMTDSTTNPVEAAKEKKTETETAFKTSQGESREMKDS